MKRLWRGLGGCARAVPFMCAHPRAPNLRTGTKWQNRASTLALPRGVPACREFQFIRNLFTKCTFFDSRWRQRSLQQRTAHSGNP